MRDRSGLDGWEIVFVGFVVNAGIFSVLSVVLFVGSEWSEVVVVVQGWGRNVDVAAWNIEIEMLLK